MKVLESTEQYYEILVDLCLLEGATAEAHYIEDYQKNKRTAHSEVAV